MPKTTVPASMPLNKTPYYYSHLIGLAYYALVVAQHERRLDDVRQCGHLLVTEHPLEQRELTPAEFCISVTTVTIRPLRPLRPLPSKKILRNFSEISQSPGKL